MDVEGEVLLKHLNKSKLKNRTKMFLEQNFSLFIVKFKKLEFSTPLRFYRKVCYGLQNLFHYKVCYLALKFNKRY